MKRQNKLTGRAAQDRPEVNELHATRAHITHGRPGETATRKQPKKRDRKR